jgi:hypothetical protein
MHITQEFLWLVAARRLAWAGTALFASVGSTVLQAGPYDTAVLADDPFAYYRFEEATGSVAANAGSSGAGFNGSYVGGYSLGQAGYGNLGSAVAFNGINAYVQALQSVGAGSFTVEGWIKTTANSLSGTYAYQGNGTVWSDVGGGANDWTVSILNNRLAVFTGDTNTGMNAGPVLNDGAWHHFAVARNAGVATSLYVDGISVGSFAAGSAALTANPVIRIGANTLDGRYFNGLLDEVAIYQTALNGMQILSHYQAATEVVPPGESVGAHDSAIGLLVMGLAGLIGFRRWGGKR